MQTPLDSRCKLPLNRCLNLWTPEFREEANFIMSRTKACIPQGSRRLRILQSMIRWTLKVSSSQVETKILVRGQWSSVDLAIWEIFETENWTVEVLPSHICHSEECPKATLLQIRHISSRSGQCLPSRLFTWSHAMNGKAPRQVGNDITGCRGHGHFAGIWRWSISSDSSNT